MFKSLKKWWKYMGAKVSSVFNEKADPKVQLEQAITEAQEQHRRLKEQAANVIANQKQADMRLNSALEELEKLNRNASQAVLMAEEASKAGEAKKTQEFTDAAEKAKGAVQQNSRLLQQKLAEKQRLLSQLDQAKMQEQMNTAMSSLTEEVGQDVPTLAEVQDKIELRYAKAMGTGELQDMSVESKMLEVEQASMHTEAQARLSEIRSKLGIAEETAGSTGPATAPDESEAAEGGESAQAEGS